MRMRSFPTLVLIYALLCRVVKAVSNAEALLNPRDGIVGTLTFTDTEVVNQTSTLFQTKTLTFTESISLNPDVHVTVEMVPTASISTVIINNSLVLLRTNTIFVPAIVTFTSSSSEETRTTSTTTSAPQLSTTLIQSTGQMSTTSSQRTIPDWTNPTQIVGQETSSSPPSSSGKKRAAVIVGVFTSCDVVLNEEVRDIGGWMREMSPPPPLPSDEKNTQAATILHGPSPSHDPSLLAEQVRVLQAQLQALQAHNDAAGTSSTVTDDPTSSVTRLSAMKREQTLVVRNYDTADLVVHTDSGLRLEPTPAVEELPPTYVERKSFTFVG
ncbi:hypothetical protein MVEN_01555700 [Mycena venus]|uniref:Uncharacterized protein n=1 Tax=Mycena venus TaxID=2733690 RepID=A0A8H6XP62_9AGAR|nr:hypothetical protein MVEN_01555700 [Mycena venus]